MNKDYAQRRKKRLVDRMRSASDPAEAARLAVTLYNSCYKGAVRQDAEGDTEEPDSWMTTENGHHVPLDKNGVALAGGGGTLKGVDFSDAESSPATATSESAKPKSTSRTTRAHDVGMQELSSLKVGSELQLNDGKTFKVTEDSGERWLEGDDGSAYSLDMYNEIQSFVEEYGNAREGSLKKAKITSPSSEPTESDLQEYRNKIEDAYSADSPQDFDEMYRDQTAEIWKSLDKETKDAVADYTGHTYRDINESLRNGNDSKYAGDISKITDTIEKSELQDDTLLYRGVDAQGFENLMGMPAGSLTPENVGQLVGKSGEEKGFMSTCSTSEGVYYKGSKVQMEILAPAGTKALYVEPFAAYSGGRIWNGETGQSTFSSEDETIVQRGSSLAVLSAEYDESSKTYKLQMAIAWQDDVSNNDSRSDSADIRTRYRDNRKKRMVQRMRNATGSEAARLAALIYDEFYRTSRGDEYGRKYGWYKNNENRHYIHNRELNNTAYNGIINTDWDEEDHPRDEDGKFSGNGSSSRSQKRGEKTKYAPSNQRQVKGIQVGHKKYARLNGLFGTQYPNAKPEDGPVTIMDADAYWKVMPDGYGGFTILGRYKIE